MMILPFVYDGVSLCLYYICHLEGSPLPLGNQSEVVFVVYHLWIAVVDYSVLYHPETYQHHVN